MTQHTPQANSYDVVIIEAGSIGCNTANHLADDYDILVLEESKLGKSVSTNANAFISNWWFFLGGGHIPGVIVKARDYLEELSATGDFKLHAQLFISLVDENEAGNPETRKIRKDVKKIPGIKYFDVDELAESYPDVLNLRGFVDGIVDTEAGYAKPRPYLRVMRRRAKRKSVELGFGTEVTGVETETGSVTDVTMAPGGFAQYDNVVVATGTHAESLAVEFTDLPVQPFVICAAVIWGDPMFNGLILTTFSRETLIRPNADSDLLVNDEYWIEDLDSVPRDSPREAQEKVAELLPRLSTGFDDGLEYINGGGRRYPEGITITPNQIPVIDEADGVNRLVVVNGNHGAVSIAPVIAVTVQSILTGTEAEFSLGRSTIDRFNLGDPGYNLPMITEPRS